MQLKHERAVTGWESSCCFPFLVLQNSLRTTDPRGFEMILDRVVSGQTFYNHVYIPE